MTPFLNLPRELRDDIYELVLGTRTVHLVSEYVSIPGPSSAGLFTSIDTVFCDELYFRPCVEIKTEREAHEISQDLDLNDPYGIMPGVPEDRCRYCKRHSMCGEYSSIPWWGGRQKNGSMDTVYPLDRSHTALLQVARTVYHEASAILYANTVFSFKFAHTLTMFPRTLTPLQRHAVKRIHLDINLDTLNDIWSWKSDDLRSALVSLPGLQDLHLIIRQSCKGDLGAFLETLREGSLPLWETDLVHFSRFSLRDVTVVVEDIDSALYRLGGTEPWRHRFEMLEWEGHWTMGERAECARVLKNKLLAI